MGSGILRGRVSQVNEKTGVASSAICQIGAKLHSFADWLRIYQRFLWSVANEGDRDREPIIIGCLESRIPSEPWIDPR